jgi:hypothetical protein
MITGHSWGAGEGRRAWMYLGMAVRMSQVIGLFEESGVAKTRDDFIVAEERRRTAWTAFLMDSLLSGGKGRRRSLGVHDMQIALPCDSENFNFGEPVFCERIDGSLPPDVPTRAVGKLGIVAHSMRVADVWGAVARWACSSLVEDELPWEANSEIQCLLKALDQWRLSLPDRLQFSVFSLHAHSASDQGQAFCYMHSIYFMCIMFLHRSYLPEVEPGKQHDTGTQLDGRWLQWKTRSRQELLKSVDRVCEMLEEMRSFGLFFLRGLVPWIGFTAYTAVGTMLYYHHFPDPDDDEDITNKAREHVVNGCAFLKDMRGSWPMADTWRETIKQMQIFYSNIKTKGEQGVSRNERREMKNALVDYGALQPSPVHEQPLSVEQDLQEEAVCSTPKLPSQRLSDTQQAFSSVSPASHVSPGSHVSQTLSQSQSDSADEPGDPAIVQTSSSVPGKVLDEFVPDFDMFDMDYQLDDADLEAAIADATQGFWANFPGEMELY